MNGGAVIANEISGKRISALMCNTNRNCDLSNLLISQADGMFFEKVYEFDKVQADVPCSSDGAFRKMPELYNV